MTNRALIIPAGSTTPVALKTWTSVDLEKRDVIIVLGIEESPHADIEIQADKLSADSGVPILYLRPEDQERWKIADLLALDGGITQRLNVGILEALDWGAKTITIVGSQVYPMTTDFFERTGGALRGAAPHWLLSSKTGWWNAGSLLDPPFIVRGFPISQRHVVPELVREEEINAPLRPSVVVHQTIGEPDVDAVEWIAKQPESKNSRVDSNVVLASGTWCPFTMEAVTFTREVAPLMFNWPYIGRYADVWASLLAQRAMQDLGRHVVVGFPMVRRDGYGLDPLTALADELIGMRRTDLISDTLRDVQILRPPSSTQSGDMTARETLWSLHNALAGYMRLGRETDQAFAAWRTDIDKVTAR